MEYQEWLDSLKAGDRVVVRSYHGWGGAEIRYHFAKVTKRTPTNQIKIDLWAGIAFDKEGKGIGSSSRGLKLVPYDQEVKDHLERTRLVYKITGVRYSELPLDVLRQINDIIDKEIHDA